MGLSSTQEGREALKNTKVVTELCRLIGDQLIISKPVLTTLINLCEDSELRANMSKDSIVESVMENLKDSNYPLKNLCLMLLSNLSQSEVGAGAVLQMRSNGGALMGLNVCRLVSWFIDPENLKNVTPENPSDSLQYVSTILNNITQLDEGRELIVDQKRNILPKILPFLKSPNEIRRIGISGTIRNICMDQEKHQYLLFSPDINILPKLLYPIAGPEKLSARDRYGLAEEVIAEGKNKKREKNIDVLKNILESLLLLSGSLTGRNELRRGKAYPIIRNFHSASKNNIDPKIDDLCFELVERIMGDEAREKDRYVDPVIPDDDPRVEELDSDEDDDEEVPDLV